MSMMLNDPSLHSSFLNHGGLERILEELRTNIKRDELICSVRKISFIKSNSFFSLDGLYINYSSMYKNPSIIDTI